jgi:hypothetical protein
MFFQAVLFEAVFLEAVLFQSVFLEPVFLGPVAAVRFFAHFSLLSAASGRI